MKVLILGLVLFSLVHSQYIEEEGDVDENQEQIDKLLAEGYVLQPDGSYSKTVQSQSEIKTMESKGYVSKPGGKYVKQQSNDDQIKDLLSQGYVLQPDGTYLKMEYEEADNSDQIRELLEQGYVLQPDGTYLRTITENNPIKTEVVDDNEDVDVIDKDEVVQDNANPNDVEYNFKVTNNIFTVGKGKSKGTFKVSRGDPDNDYDYSVQAIESPKNPVPLKNTGKDCPKVYPSGTRGKVGYKTIIGVGKGLRRTYIRIKPDSTKPSGFEFSLQKITTDPVQPVEPVSPGATESADSEEEDDDDDNPDDPQIKKKPGYSVISVGNPNRRYVRLRHTSNSPYDFDLKPIKHPDQPDSSPDDDDDDAPQILPNGEKGTPSYMPVIAYGPSANRRYISVIPNANNKNKFKFRTVHVQPQPGVVVTEPNDDDVIYDDQPENINYKTVKVPGQQFPHEFISVGPLGHKVHFRIVRRSNRPGDVDVQPILDLLHPNSPPSKSNDYISKVCEKGDPTDPNNLPIIALGTRFKKFFYKLLIRKGKVCFIPVRRVRISRGKYRYILKTRRWHYITIRKRVVPPPPVVIKRPITVKKCGGGFIFAGFFASGTCTPTEVIDRGWHPSRRYGNEAPAPAKSGGGFLSGIFG